MIIKEKKYKACKECGHREFVSDEEYGCDNCKKPIDLDKQNQEREYLGITVFYGNAEHVDNLHLCSWHCVFQKLKTIKTNDFISLPYLSFDMANPKMGPKGFWEAIKHVT